MDYQKVYNQIIERAQDRILEGYGENHHITPRCLGGGDEKENLVKLTAREHFLVHWLLARIYPDNRKLLFALTAMCNFKSREKRYFPSSRVYNELKEQLSKIGKSEEHKRKIGEANKISQLLRPPTSQETRAKLSEAHKGKFRDRETVEKIRIANTGKKRDEIFKTKISTALKGKTHNPKTIEKRRKSLLLIRDQISKSVSATRVGMRHSSEAKENMRKAAILREQKKREQR